MAWLGKLLAKSLSASLKGLLALVVPYLYDKIVAWIKEYMKKEQDKKAAKAKAESDKKAQEDYDNATTREERIKAGDSILDPDNE